MANSLKDYMVYPIIRRKLNWREKLTVSSAASVGYCVVCGKITVFANFKSENLRESGNCFFCKSSNRQRQLSFILCKRIAEEKKIKIGSLSSLSKLENFIIYNTEANGAVHNILSKSCRKYRCSEYFGIKCKSGEKLNGVENQNLMELSIEDNSVDILLSADVLEHLPFPYKAHSEIYRVLKRGGRHIFTVPFYQAEFFDEQRVQLQDDGELMYLKDPQYHDDPIRGQNAVLVYYIFGLEMLIKLRKIGLETNFYKIYNPELGIIGDNALVFEAIKK